MLTEYKSKEFRIFELLSISIKTYSQNLGAILIIHLIINLPVNIISVFIDSVVQRQSIYYQSGLYLIVTSLLATPRCIAFMAVITTVEQYILDGKIDYGGAALKKAFSRLGALRNTSRMVGVFALIFYFLVIVPAYVFFANQFFLGFLFLPVFFIPVMILLVNGYFLLEVISLRNMEGKAALSYSKSIVQGRWWKVFFLGIILITNWFLLYEIFNFILAGLKIHFLNKNNMVYDVYLAQFSSLIFHFSAVVNTIFFLNLEYRKN